MIRLIWLCTLLFLGATATQVIAAPIYITNYPSEANAKVFVTQYKSEADLVVYFTKYKSEARCRY